MAAKPSKGRLGIGFKADGVQALDCNRPSVLEFAADITRAECWMVPMMFHGGIDSDPLWHGFPQGEELAAPGCGRDARDAFQACLRLYR